MHIPQLKNHRVLPEHAFGSLLPKRLHLFQYVHQHVCKNQCLYVTKSLPRADQRVIAILEDPATTRKHHGMLKELAIKHKNTTAKPTQNKYAVHRINMR